VPQWALTTAGSETRGEGALGQYSTSTASGPFPEESKRRLRRRDVLNFGTGEQTIRNGRSNFKAGSLDNIALFVARRESRIAYSTVLIT